MNRIALILAAVLLALPMTAQTVKDGSYRTVAHIESDGTVKDSAYRTIGHAGRIPRRWAALYFFFFFR